MMLKLPSPRLLPMTIAALTGLLAFKIGVLVDVSITHGPKPVAPIVATAHAAGTEAAAETEHGKPRPNEQKPPPPPPPVAEGPPPVSESEKALLLELRQRRKELDSRNDTIAMRESVLVATEQKLSARVTELRTLQTKLEGIDSARKQKEDAGWQGLVKLYEAMKPKDAATIFNDLSMPVLLQVLGRMKDAKAASVMSAMNPDKAREVTGELARLRIGHDPAAAGG